MKLILGYGRSGQKVADVLSKRGEFAYVSDIEEKKDVKVYPSIEYIWGDHPLWLLDKVDEIILSPGIPKDINFLKKAKERNIKIISELEWALEQINGIKLGITGTNGKTTTTSLISHIFSFNGIKSITAGNIGIPLSSLLEEEPFDVYAIEISSFQLEVMSKKLLDGALLLNITPDHIDRHKSFENYLEIKKNIFNLLKKGGVGVAPEGLFPELILSRYGNSKNCELIIEKEKFIFEGKEILKRDDLKLLGDHNWENAAGAVLLSLKFGIEGEKIKKPIEVFRPLEHRMEIVDEVNGITFINDSKGTNVDSVVKALTGVPDKKTVLILGGKDKGSDFSPLKEDIKKKCLAVFCIGEAKEKIFHTLNNLNIKIILKENLEDVFSSLDEVLENGSFVLLSPGCASFDQYKNYEERGKHFKELVRKWKERKSRIL